MTNFERIVARIVEGQIRGFLKEHPALLKAVDWYKPRKDKTTTFANSLSKRIVRDLTCGTTAARLRAALLELPAEDRPQVSHGIATVETPARLAAATERAGQCTDR